MFVKFILTTYLLSPMVDVKNFQLRQMVSSLIKRIKKIEKKGKKSEIRAYSFRIKVYFFRLEMR